MSDQPLSLDRPELTIRPMAHPDLAVVRRMVATAFAGEPFAVGMFGTSPVDRLVGMVDEYEHWPESPDALVLVGSAGPSLVAVILATLPGKCRLCDEWQPAHEVVSHTQPKADAVENAFQARCRLAHLSSSLPTHAHIQTVVTEPFLAGAGIGHRMVRELLERLYSEGARSVVLECLTTRQAFYERCGFRATAEFMDPGGDDLPAVMMQIDALEAGFERPG